RGVLPPRSARPAAARPASGRSALRCRADRLHPSRLPSGASAATVASAPPPGSQPYTGFRTKEERPMGGGMFLTAVVLVAGIVILFKTVRMVPQGYEWTVERFGRYTHTMTPGLHFLIPVVYGVGRKVNMMEQVLDVPSQEVITKDNAAVKVDGVVFFMVRDAAKAAYEVSNLEFQMIALVTRNISTAI